MKQPCEGDRGLRTKRPRAAFVRVNESALQRGSWITVRKIKSVGISRSSLEGARGLQYRVTRRFLFCFFNGTITLSRDICHIFISLECVLKVC